MKKKSKLILLGGMTCLVALSGVMYWGKNESQQSVPPDIGAISLGGISPSPQEIAEIKVTDDHMGTVDGRLAVGEKISNDVSIKTIALDKRVIYQDEGAYSLGIEKAFSGSDKTVALVSVGSGGSACPVQYRFVLVRGNGTVEVTDEFGTCSDLPTVSANQGEINVSLPDMGGSGNEAWKYSGDKLVKVVLR